MTRTEDTSMLGRGVKRKWSSVEALDAAAEETQRRDGADAASGGSGDTGDMRRRVLGLSLEKLQRYRAGVELSLRRSVLLINTLRQIQDEMRGDVQENLNAVFCAPDSPVLHVDLKCPGCAEGGQESPSSALVSSSPEVNFGAISDVVNAMGYLSDLALDDIFEDIDTSMYETSDMSAGWTAGSLWPVGVSVWADEDGKGPVGSLQSCLMDVNELDHIMEILVKS
ncbi:cell division cycle-associated protein 4 isoform X1 [Phycodurus eques]|uniref:cell division cycle-associated protein 4 isoform X1 n=2 Tax=Phycodurus eques TaxID=693459 RepID=UPI002ACDF4D0|nr:cell division cycle-associated protein 4 isoform X1 [Phycodurus eques]